jgi:hypothetical protein
VNAQPNITGLSPEWQVMNSSVIPFGFEGHTVRAIRALNPRRGISWWR